MKKINITTILIVAFAVYFFFQNRANKAERKRYEHNFSVAKSDIENRLDDLGKAFKVVESSVLTAKEMEKYSNIIIRELGRSDIKTKNIIKAGLAGIESHYHFTVLKDTIVKGDTIFIQYYKDPKGWFVYEQIGGDVTFNTIDTVLYSTFLERRKRNNGKKPFWPIAWTYKKEQKELFKSLNPNSTIYFFKVDELK